jgi:S-adenosylmethionine synthetase
MSRRYIFSSESVTEGHPDKVCDTISDSVLDACLAEDRHSRVACETYAKSNVVIVGGEITTKAKLDYVQIVRDTVREIGYVNDDDVFHADKIFVSNIITKQSPDIAQGVDACAADGKETAEQGAGDQGLMFGYACDDTPELMPAPIMFAHRLGRELTRLRKSGKVGWLRPDAKSQVSVIYENGKPIGISCVVVSTQHSRDVKHSEIRSFVIEEVIKKVLPAGMLSSDTQFPVNPTGNFVIGGPQGDTGLTGRKIIVDSMAEWAATVAALFRGKIRAKSIAARLTWDAGWQRLWLRRGWQKNAKFNLLTQSGIPNR